MELTEKIETINQQLIDHFGVDTITGLPMWRVVWSEDQFEKRLMETTDSGILLAHPEVREVPKYRQWIQKKYVLEHLVVVPEASRNELPSSRLSYEPIYPFQDNDENYLPPKFILCKFVIDGINAALGKSSLAKYKDPDNEAKDPEIAREMQRARVDELYESLYGDESSLNGAIVHGSGIAMPQEYGKVKKEN